MYITPSISLFTPNNNNIHPEILVVSSVNGTVYCSYYGTHTFQRVAEPKGAAVVFVAALCERLPLGPSCG